MMLMKYLYTISQIRAIEHAVIQQGITEAKLMEQAGVAALKILRDHYPHAQRLDILCGKGNNGRDGLVMANHAAQQGMDVTVYYFADCPMNSHANINYQPYHPSAIFQGDVIVDALFGIGFTGKLEGIFETAARAVNQSGKPVVAVDIPSGVNADQGGVLGEAVCANLTVTFIGIKQGMLTGLAPNYCGKIVCDDLGLSVPASASAVVLESNDVLSSRKPADHKGCFGHVLVIGGDVGMGGAVCLAAEAALRCGAGLVTVITRPEHVSALLTRCPEVMCLGVGEKPDLKLLGALLARATVCVVGPGLSDSAWSDVLLAWLFTQAKDIPMVIDAGALIWLAKHKKHQQRISWVLTPHPGEAARLLGMTAQNVQQQRFVCSKQLQQKYQGVMVLKGAGTLICGDDALIQVCDYQHGAMATAGVGDVLSGIIGGLMAQGCAPFQAASQGVWLHAQAGKKLIETSHYPSILAHELLASLTIVE